MCGISCYTHSGEKETVLYELKKSLNRITHRGHAKTLFETETWENVGLGCHRLPFTSGNEKQPVTSDSGRYKVLLNGEIYNLHPTCLGENTDSDTKRFANSLDRQGLGALANLDGMFALIMLDTQKRLLHFVRDKLGIKPLYYAVNARACLASSEIKGISHFSKFDSINHVPPGSVVTIPLDTLEVEMEVFSRQDDIDVAPEEFPAVLLNALRKSVLECTSDRYNYGIFLSGGIDSSLIYALMHEAGRNVRPIVLGSENAGDRNAAVALCEHYGQVPYKILCPDEAELFRTIHTTIRTVESFEPNLVRQSSLSMLLAQGAQAMGMDVVLCGEGADELFGGYPELVRSKNFSTDRQKFLEDLHRTQLQRVDRTAMAHTVEVRVPFLSNDVINLALSSAVEHLHVNPGAVPGKRSKILLRKAAGEVLGEEIRWRSKAVLSEGAGLRGNHPTNGMFADIFRNGLPQSAYEVAPNDASEWSLTSSEERFYFKIFKQFGYEKYVDAKMRVHANAIHTS